MAKATPPDPAPGDAHTDRPPAAPPADLPAELARHPRFRVVRELGRGGMGVVYEAEHRMMERRVALKVINRSLLDHPDALARFHAEVKAAARLDHPNIVRAYDAEQAGELHLLVMEYVEGTDLAKVVARKGPLAVAHACHFVRQAALGLQHAHEQGMAHRDIKPQNLMLTPKGRVKVLDFGLARLRAGQAQTGGLTQQGAFMGTPEYVAPEQATDARAADTRADIYSLGCTLYCLLAGHPPFAGDTAVKLVLAHLQEEPPPLRQARPDVPPELEAVVGRMLAKDPARRYQTPAEVALALAPFVRPGATPAPAPKTATALQGGKRPAPGKGATMPAAAPLAGLGEGARSGAPAGPARRKPKPVLLFAGAAVAGLVAVAVVAGVLLRARGKHPAGEAALVPPGTRADAPGPSPAVPPVPKTPVEKWFAAGARWEGKGTSKTGPWEWRVWFTVRAREGNKFTGRITGEGRMDLIAEGTLADDGASFRVDKVRQRPNVWARAQSVEGFEAGGKITADDVQIDWKWPRSDGQVLEGLWTFTAQRDGPQKDDEDAWPPPLHPRRANVLPGGKWSVQGDELVQEEFGEDTGIGFGDIGWKDYDFHLKAMKTAGDNGFIIVFDQIPPKQTQWCIGLGGTTYVETFEVLPTGNKLTPLSERPAATVADNQWYDILIQTRGQWIECFLDGQSLFKIAHPDRWGGKVGITCLRMAARFKDIEVKTPDGKVLWEGPPELPE